MSLLKHWWPALVWAVVISLFSTGTFTSENTSRIIIPILHWLMPHAAMATLLEIHHVIRKCGHFTEYFILSILVLRGIRGDRRDVRIIWALAAVAIVACYASLDEVHQIFVPGRTPATADVLLDTVGGLCAQIAVAFALLMPEKADSGQAAPYRNQDRLLFGCRSALFTSLVFFGRVGNADLR